MANATLALGILNNTLRIAMDCGAFNLWFESEPSGVGVAWHGKPAWDFVTMKSRLGLNYQVLTDLPPPEDNLYPDMLALVKGVADISIDYWGVNYGRSKLIDFTFPQGYTTIHIISGRKDGYSGADLVMGVYDDTSFYLLNMALVAEIFMLWLLLKREGRGHSIITSALYLFENAMHQPLNRLLVPNTWLGRITVTFFTFYNLALNFMYMSIIISLLIGGSPPPAIDSLADLSKEEYQAIRIFMVQRSYVPQFLKSANMLDNLEHRIDYIDTPDMYKPFAFEGILAGTHVFIASEGNFNSFLCKTNENENKTVAVLQDFRKSRQDIKVTYPSLPKQLLYYQRFFVFNKSSNYYAKRLLTCCKD